jgi:hypothetical protein
MGHVFILLVLSENAKKVTEKLRGVFGSSNSFNDNWGQPTPFRR